MTLEECQACGSDHLDAFYETSNVPSQSCILLDSKSETEDFPTGHIVLVLCESCGFIQNSQFDPSLVDYEEPTEESQAFSGEFQQFAEALADELVQRYDLVGRTAFEVGCGKGEFLATLAAKGLDSVVGIDPGYLPSRLETPENAEFLRAWFGPDNTHLTGDLVLSRHLMEHVSNVQEYLGYLRESVQRSSTGWLFTEVPDTTRVLDEGAFWDVYYEHCSYSCYCPRPGVRPCLGTTC